MKTRGGAVAVGGPWLTWKLMPTEEDLRKKYDQADFNMGADERRRKREVFDDYMKEIVELSKSNKNGMLCSSALLFRIFFLPLLYFPVILFSLPIRTVLTLWIDQSGLLMRNTGRRRQR